MKISELVAQLEAIKGEHGDLDCRWQHLRGVDVVEVRPMARSFRTDDGYLVEEHWSVVYLGAASWSGRSRREDPKPGELLLFTYGRRH